jgi:hypothetical protein
MLWIRSNVFQFLRERRKIGRKLTQKAKAEQNSQLEKLFFSFCTKEEGEGSSKLQVQPPTLQSKNKALKT